MVKKGPCLRCGTNYTPLCHNGPHQKPVLCNACGSRYNLRGHLNNYLPKNIQLQLCQNNFKNAHGRSHPNVEDQFSNHVPRIDGVNSNLWNKTPSRERSQVVYKRMTPTHTEEITLLDNVNNFIPENEKGLGVILLKTYMNVASTNSGSATCSSTDN